MAKKNDVYERAPKFCLSYPDGTLKSFLIRQGFVFAPMDKAEFIFFPGGADINPFLYGERPHPKYMGNLKRDLQEIALLRCIPDNLFKIGVCRGAQLINVVLGNGRMYQHVTGHCQGPHRIYDTHIKGEGIMVTSVHHQMMIPGPSGCVLYAAAEATTKETFSEKIAIERGSGVLKLDDPEVIYYPEHNAICWQPHPEYEHGPDSAHQRLFVETLETFCLTTSQQEARKELAKAIQEERAV